MRFVPFLFVLLLGCPATETPVELATLDTGGTADAEASDAAVDAANAGDAMVDVAPDADDADATSADATSADATSADASDEDHGDAGTDADTCESAPERGAWMYRHPGNPLGTDVIVGDAVEEATAIANLQAALVTRIYGNYGDRPVTDAATVAAWNAQLTAAGIDSQLLVGEAADIFPGCREEMLQTIQERLIDFNDGVAADERFVALHLDIEPQQYKQGAAYPTTTSCGLRVPNWPYWDDLDNAGRATRYEMLASTLADVRAYLDGNGHAATPIYVDLAPWIDSSANFDWSATAFGDGTAWLTQVATNVTGMTFMTYERDNAPLIDSSVAGESTLATDLRVSVSAKERAPLSTITTWADLPAMWAVVEELEATHCGDRPVDLFAYRYLHE